MTIFTRHPHEQGISYLEHWVFAMGIALRLLRSVMAFAVHAVLPGISIEKRLDLEATSAYLLQQNEFIEAAAKAGRAEPSIYPIAFFESIGGPGGCAASQAQTFCISIRR